MEGVASPKLQLLQILRALAAALVVYDHARLTYAEKVLSQPLVAPDFVDWSRFGVELFFCISGFIVFRSATNFQGDLQGAFAFLLRRLVRIVPLYWLATGIYSVKLALQGQPPPIEDILLSCFFVPYVNPETHTMFPVIGAGWTLNYEMFFYLLVSGSLLLGRTSRFPVVASLLLLLVAISEATVPAVESVGNAVSLRLLLEPYLLFFVLGMIIDVTTRPRAASNHSLPDPGVRSADCPVRWLVTFCFFLVLLGWSEGLAGHLLACALVVGFAVSLTLRMNGSSGMQKLFVLAGDASYCTYLTHGFVMGPSARLIAFLEFDPSAVVFAIIQLGTCTVVGILVHVLLDQPVRTGLRDRLGL